MAKYNTQSDLKNIIKRYLEGKASEEEKAFLDMYYSFFEKENNVLDSISVSEKQQLEETLEANILKAINKKPLKSKIIQLIPYRRIATAALFLLTSLGTYFYLARETGKQEPVNAMVKADSVDNVVMLTLSDGKIVKLEDLETGLVAQQNGVRIEKAADGSIIYDVSVKNDNSAGFENTFNTITTPNGKQSQVSLPDGTKVWLNAESSLKYPVAFSGQQRLVELKGEAYFEVTKSKEKPFIVKAKETETKVLGTKFNINAYQNDDFVKTTLTEGSVAVSKNNSSKILKPGEQAVAFNNQTEIKVSEADLEEALAWKNGYFMFNNLDIKTVMNMISRWYDIEVVYEGNVENETFIGTVSRFDSIDKLLKTIELTGGVHFRIEDRPNTKRRKVVVMP